MKKLLALLGIVAMATMLFVGCNNDPAPKPDPDPDPTPVEKPDSDTPGVPDEEEPGAEEPGAEEPGAEEPGEETPAEIVLYEKAAADWVNCSNLGDLSVIDGQEKIVITFENTGADGRNGWGVGNIGFSTNANDVYNTQHETQIEAKFVGEGKTAEQEIVIADYADIIATNKYLTANMWNNCVIIKVVLK